ncbi:glutaredoxin family protein [Solimonas variicoloris]|uniref:glutaredoxin family protein n=1 Tax=Solimonas variicoloris TaxID=254408 RepID=UPI0003A6C6C6|nr:glutaredoxin family protein [Solimonas variicoloris]
MPDARAGAPAPWLLLSRPDCHLCEAFEEALQAHLGAALPPLERACVDARGEWRMRYGQRIPVLLDADGRVLAEGVFEPADFERARRGPGLC